MNKGDSTQAINSVTFYRFRGRLAQFRRLETLRDYWEERWSTKKVAEFLDGYGDGHLDEFERIFTQYLRRDLPILEAGCGLGQLVKALSCRGYKTEGVDYAAQTVARLWKAAPELSIRVGDVYHLEAADGSYGGYISIGIFEHHQDLPLEGLLEARRVLDRRGIALISVPFLNERRRGWLKSIPEVNDGQTGDGLRFYQYYFSANDFQGLLSRAGFEVVEMYPYGVYSGLTRDFEVGAWLKSHGFLFSRLRHLFSRWCTQAPQSVRWRWAHMLMFVCRPRC